MTHRPLRTSRFKVVTPPDIGALLERPRAGVRGDTTPFPGQHLPDQQRRKTADRLPEPAPHSVIRCGCKMSRWTTLNETCSLFVPTHRADQHGPTPEFERPLHMDCLKKGRRSRSAVIADESPP